MERSRLVPPADEPTMECIRPLPQPNMTNCHDPPDSRLPPHAVGGTHQAARDHDQRSNPAGPAQSTRRRIQEDSAGVQWRTQPPDAAHFKATPPPSHTHADNASPPLAATAAPNASPTPPLDQAIPRRPSANERRGEKHRRRRSRLCFAQRRS